MNYTKLLLATLGGTVAFFLAGWVIWGIVLEPIMADHYIHYDGLRKEVPNMMLMILAMLVTALLYAIIFHRWASISTFATGAKAGAIISLLAGLGTSLMFMSMMNWADWTVVFSDVVGNLIYGAIGGGVIWMDIRARGVM